MHIFNYLDFDNLLEFGHKSRHHNTNFPPENALHSLRQHFKWDYYKTCSENSKEILCVFSAFAYRCFFILTFVLANGQWKKVMPFVEFQAFSVRFVAISRFVHQFSCIIHYLILHITFNLFTNVLIGFS